MGTPRLMTPRLAADRRLISAMTESRSIGPSVGNTAANEETSTVSE